MTRFTRKTIATVVAGLIVLIAVLSAPPESKGTGKLLVDLPPGGILTHAKDVPGGSDRVGSIGYAVTFENSDDFLYIMIFKVDDNDDIQTNIRYLYEAGKEVATRDGRIVMKGTSFKLNDGVHYGITFTENDRNGNMLTFDVATWLNDNYYALVIAGLDKLNTSDVVDIVKTMRYVT